MSTQMDINGLYASFNMPQALKDSAFTQGLPPYAPQLAHKVDEYNCPDNWMHGSGKVSSYFVGVAPDKGMWLDFTANARHKHHVAVLVSIQGVNPITGQKQMGFALEQYKEKCPVHGCSFGQDRFCPQCNYKWPPQNYLSTTGGSSLWIDGFRNAQGEVRQYVFTEETAKGVATQLIGEDRVFAIGVAFYLSKQPKPVPVPHSYLRGGKLLSGGMVGGDSDSWGSLKSMSSESGVLNAMPAVASSGLADESFGEIETRSLSRGAPRRKQIEVAAGAKIRQEISLDPENIETFWETEAAGFLYINYCDVETCNHILSEGKRDLTAGGEGFLAAVEKYHQ